MSGFNADNSPTERRDVCTCPVHPRYGVEINAHCPLHGYDGERPEPTEPRVTLTGSSKKRNWLVTYGAEVIYSGKGWNVANRMAKEACQKRRLKSWWNLKANGEFVECPI